MRCYLLSHSKYKINSEVLIELDAIIRTHIYKSFDSYYFLIWIAYFGIGGKMTEKKQKRLYVTKTHYRVALQNS